MFSRPRCREWTPLSTQQLRLRSLIQIVGYNIRPPEGCMSQCSFYLTLHHTTMSAPFYTSERVNSPHPKWKEIDSETTQRMSSTNVVIRIWCHILRPNSDDPEKPQDTIIETWGVYFSGLRYIGANLALNFTSDCFKSNTLVFQMHGGYFCSYKSLKLDIIPPENEIEHGSLSSDSSGKTPKVTLESRFLQNQKVKGSRSISPTKFPRKYEKEVSKSHSPVDRSFIDYPTIKTSTSLNIHGQNDRRNEGDPSFIYEHSPDHKDVTSDSNCDNSGSTSHDNISNPIDLSETAENYDLRNETHGVPKYRYIALSFLKSEIRPSYNSTKLQKLHLLQYAIKKKQEAVQDIKERIYKKSALTNDISDWDDLDFKLKFKSRSQRNLFSSNDENLDEKSMSQTDLSRNGRINEERKPNGPRLNLKLNDLLSFKSKPSPFQRAEHVRLTKQLEVLRFKRILLVDERDSKLANIRRLKETYTKMYEANQDVGLELLQNYHTLSKYTDGLNEMRQSCQATRERAVAKHKALATYRTELLNNLHQIFYIDQKVSNKWTICDVPLPICGDENPRSFNPVSDSVSAGFVAQATVLAAALLGQPLRYKITLLGSATKILDITPDLPDPNIPLFALGGDITLFRYAMFLLNKSIAQLLWGRGLAVTDIRPTLANLQRLLITPCNLSDTSKLFGTYNVWEPQCSRAQSMRSLTATDRGKHNRQFNRFKDSVDGQSPESAMNQRRHRTSRSVGSYNDDQERNEASPNSMMWSEPIIYDTDTISVQTTEQSFTKHHSESEISTICTCDTKVVFTMGDEEICDLKPELLVRISSNNGDKVCTCAKKDLKNICTEIKDYCEIKTERYDKQIDGTDIAKHRESSVLEVCLNCDDDGCTIECSNNVKEVIVIPSAEAILDTGHINIEVNNDLIINDARNHLDNIEEQFDKLKNVTLCCNVLKIDKHLNENFKTNDQRNEFKVNEEECNETTNSQEITVYNDNNINETGTEVNDISNNDNNDTQ